MLRKKRVGLLGRSLRQDRTRADSERDAERLSFKLHFSVWDRT